MVMAGKNANYKPMHITREIEIFELQGERTNDNNHFMGRGCNPA